ncbi:unnamed protein product [Clonostachys chloroleuca]|uniref:Uncharacterized protein n=1 Tax=Clonostachys chloroleuca TaxID=1926264 RepID=A0AA35QF53_9HYPO|nr:unnamed protein product [Clonostachys chloroleuca]
MSPLFVTEPSHGSQSFGSNYPRTWDELEKFFHWLQVLPYEEQTTPEPKQIGAEAAEYFVQGFCDFWFPGFLQFIGRDRILTFIPPQCRRRQRKGEPNWLRSELIKLVIKLYHDVHDYLLSDPAEPDMT